MTPGFWNIQCVLTHWVRHLPKGKEYESGQTTFPRFPNHISWTLCCSYFWWHFGALSLLGQYVHSQVKIKAWKAEHILHGSPLLTIHLHLLFNSMIQHGYVPSEFLWGVLSPIIKDAEGDSFSVDNYRGILLSDIFSYLLDPAILLKIHPYLIADDL